MPPARSAWPGRGRVTWRFPAAAPSGSTDRGPHHRLPVGEVAVEDADRDGGAEGDAPADTALEERLVLLDLHAAAATVAVLAAREVAGDGGRIDTRAPPERLRGWRSGGARRASPRSAVAAAPRGSLSIYPWASRARLRVSRRQRSHTGRGIPSAASRLSRPASLGGSSPLLLLLGGQHRPDPPCGSARGARPCPPERSRAAARDGGSPPRRPAGRRSRRVERAPAVESRHSRIWASMASAWVRRMPRTRVCWSSVRPSWRAARAERRGARCVSRGAPSGLSAESRRRTGRRGPGRPRRRRSEWSGEGLGVHRILLFLY